MLRFEKMWNRKYFCELNPSALYGLSFRLFGGNNQKCGIRANFRRIIEFPLYLLAENLQSFRVQMQ